MAESKASHILLAVTGSVATIKLPLLCHNLQRLGDVQVICTDAAQQFIQHMQLPESINVIKGSDEWSSWKAVGDAVLHIELRRWADVLVIAPLSANTLSKVAHGLSDNLLTCVVRAWDWDDRPVVVAPAMNTLMWDSPFTREHLHRLEQLGTVVVPPVAKTLACGDVGVGGMASPEGIAEVVQQVLETHKAWQERGGRKGKGAKWRMLLQACGLARKRPWALHRGGWDRQQPFGLRLALVAALGGCFWWALSRRQA